MSGTRRNSTTETVNATLFDTSINLKKVHGTGGGERQWPVLITIEGEDLKSRYTIDKPEFVLGRDHTCEIVLNDTKSSRQHSRLRYVNFAAPMETPKVTIEDLGSTNGTYVNGTRIEEPAALKDRDKIMIGSTLLGFWLQDESMIRAEQRLIRQATTDALTTLNNRAVFDMELNREFQRAKRYRRDLSLVMFDIDHFKKFNDTYGHQTGDKVLREIGEIVHRNTRIHDIPCRYGGEEFALILPETQLENSLLHSERLRKTVSAHPFNDSETRLSVTISVGVAAVGDSFETADDLIAAADQALYRAKENGRNQVCWHRD